MPYEIGGGNLLTGSTWNTSNFTSFFSHEITSAVIEEIIADHIATLVDIPMFDTTKTAAFRNNSISTKKEKAPFTYEFTPGDLKTLRELGDMMKNKKIGPDGKVRGGSQIGKTQWTNYDLFRGAFDNEIRATPPVTINFEEKVKRKHQIYVYVGSCYIQLKAFCVKDPTVFQIAEVPGFVYDKKNLTTDFDMELNKNAMFLISLPDTMLELEYHFGIPGAKVITREPLITKTFTVALAGQPAIKRTKIVKAKWEPVQEVLQHVENGTYEMYSSEIAEFPQASSETLDQLLNEFYFSKFQKLFNQYLNTSINEYQKQLTPDVWDFYSGPGNDPGFLNKCNIKINATGFRINDIRILIGEARGEEEHRNARDNKDRIKEGLPSVIGPIINSSQDIP